MSMRPVAPTASHSSRLPPVCRGASVFLPSILSSVVLRLDRRTDCRAQDSATFTRRLGVVRSSRRTTAVGENRSAAPALPRAATEHVP